MKELPEDVIVEILYKLPIKSLIRFSCVSKRWFWLIITDQYLAKSHFLFASEQESLTRRLLLSNRSQVESLDLENPGLDRTLTPPFQSPRDILGSCHGLTCVSFQRNCALYIWNPSTGFSQKLPDPGFGGRYYVKYSGFGYSSANEDYKLVLAAASYYEPENMEVVIFSCRTSIWRRIDDDSPPDFKEKVYQPAALLREKLHWFNKGSSEIVTFDLANEEFLVMPPPPYKDAQACACTSYGGLLYVLCSDWYPSELWVMREYGAAGSWTKLFNAGVHFSESDRIFITAETSLVVANGHSFKGSYLTHIKYKDGQPVNDEWIFKKYCKGMIMYEESLLRLPDYDN